ncbi:MAG TPA: type II CAAX endopeptidase family protein [Intrasporangium sp.]|nr:type II CAAX endopeptidase family protein [Intrasporangium sp.]
MMPSARPTTAPPALPPLPVGRPTEAEPSQPPQYSFARILGTWAAAARPMAFLAWVVAPRLWTSFDGPSAGPRAIIVCLTLGLIWQFVLVAALVRRERGTLRWSVVKEALWLRAPRSPRTGRRGGWLWLLIVPLVLGIAAKEMLVDIPIPVPADRDLGLFLRSDAGQDFFSGNWTWFALLVTMWVFNTVLGEELLFRGLLLPRMQRACGRWDWVVNGLLFTAYHLHVPWAMPKVLLDMLIVVYPSRRYRSAVLGIAAHSVQSVVFAILVLLLVLR